MGRRYGEVKRSTSETEIEARICLDGGETEISTGIGFFDHMLGSLAYHGGFGLFLSAKGDLHVDCHHLVEDAGIVLGEAFLNALGDKKGITRFAHSMVPMDEALAICALDISGRAYLAFDADFPQEKIGEYDACMTVEFMRAFAVAAKITLHMRCEGDRNSHHMTEAMFKALARALRGAVRAEGERVPSTKGLL